MERRKSTDNRIKAFLVSVVVLLAVLWPAATPAMAAVRGIVSSPQSASALAASSSLASRQEAGAETPSVLLRSAMRETAHRGPICSCVKAARRPSRPVSALPLTSALVTAVQARDVFLSLSQAAFKRPSSPHISSGAPRAPPIGS